MSRSSVPYAEREVRPVHVAGAVDVSEPVAGFFRYRMGRDTVAGGVHVWFGPPKDPVTGEELDRSWRWQAEFDGEAADFNRVWPACTGEPITEQDYRAMLARKEWARSHLPNSAYAETGRKLDLLSRDNPLPF